MEILKAVWDFFQYQILGMIKVAFICVHNSCRSQIAEALGKRFAADVFESYSAGTELKDRIDPDAVRLMKQLYGIDMQCGLSWNLMLQKREIFRACFDGFDYDRIARYDEQDVARILSTDGMKGNAAIPRQRAGFVQIACRIVETLCPQEEPVLGGNCFDRRQILIELRMGRLCGKGKIS